MRLRDGQEFTQSLSEEFELHNSDVSCPQEFEGTHVGGEGQHGKPALPPPTPPSPPPPMSSSQPGPLSPKKSPTLSSHPSSPKRSPVRTHALQFNYWCVPILEFKGHTNIEIFITKSSNYSYVSDNGQILPELIAKLDTHEALS